MNLDIAPFTATFLVVLLILLVAACWLLVHLAERSIMRRRKQRYVVWLAATINRIPKIFDIHVHEADEEAACMEAERQLMIAFPAATDIAVEHTEIIDP